MDDNDEDLPVEIEFEPKAHIDCTVHYRSSSLHMHKYMLVTMSQYFETVLTAAASDVTHESQSSRCNLTTLCSRPGHLCVSLPGSEIGGVDVNVHVLIQFMRHLYMHGDVTGQWKKCLDSEAAQRTVIPDECILLVITAVDVKKDETVYDVYEHDQITVLKLKNNIVNDVPTSKLPIGFIMSTSTPIQHLDYHLANYFQCNTLMIIYEKQAHAMITKLTTRERGLIVWLILELADRFKWSALREQCVALCAKKSSIFSESDEQWKKFALTLPPLLMLDVFQASCKLQK